MYIGNTISIIMLLLSNEASWQYSLPCILLLGNTVFRNKGAHGLDLWSTNDITSSKQIVEYNQFYSNYPGDKFQVKTSYCFKC